MPPAGSGVTPPVSVSWPSRKPSRSKRFGQPPALASASSARTRSRKHFSRSTAAAAARPYFRALSALRDRLVAGGADASMLMHLSMGMSHDFEIAVEEGATMVRVGSAIFGGRARSADL